MKVNGVNINLDNIQICTYVCDFGNVVVGGSKKRSFRLTNVGKIPINFVFDKKLLGQAGIAIDQDKGTKIMPNTSQLFTVVFTSRKNSKFGRTHFLIPIEIKNGPTYMIDFIANITIPELSMSTDNLDFEKVAMNTRKTVKLRIENTKEVSCEWWFYNPAPGQNKEASDKKKEAEFFQVWPISGTLLPGQRSTIDVMFTPHSDKAFAQKLAFKCKENPKQFVLNVKGQGINNLVDLKPDNIKLGPVLPYDTKSIECFEITNPMDHPIEIYSLDFDKQYLEEEEIIKRMDNFQVTGPNEPIFLPFRKAGDQFWQSVKVADEIKSKTEAIKAQIRKFDE
jgi:hydrocephalus-inducing protein